jgi:hypothetical protein
MLMTISPDYLKMQKELHQNPGYGVAGQIFGHFVLNLAKQIGAKSLSDYGAGKCSIRDALIEQGWTDFEYFPYDPAFPEYGEPKPADIVCCLDVLEHIEPFFLESVLLELRSITCKFGFFTVSSIPAAKTLPDGRNAHLIQQPMSWWLPKFADHFKVLDIEKLDHGFIIVVGPKKLF